MLRNLAVALSSLALPLALAACVTTPAETGPVADGQIEANPSGAAKLLPILDEKAGPTKNVFFSPVSIDYAFGLVALGAKGETAQQLAAVLPPPRAPKDYIRESDSAEVRLASRLWVDKQFGIAPAFTREAQRRYDAGAEAIDKGDKPGTVRKINGWADKQTEGLIPEVISESDITPDLALFITNALYFDADWETEFDSSEDLPFLFGDGTERDFRLMREVMPLSVMERRGWRAVRLPYRDDRYAMDVIMPDSRKVMANAPELSMIEDMGERLAAAEERLVEMRLPRFEIDTDFDLIDPLQSLGLTLPFDPMQADLSGIGASGQRNLHVGGAKQLAKLQVFDTGTRAAAVTVVKIVLTGGRGTVEKPLEFTVDRPFVVVIRDLETDAILFLGRIADPQEFEAPTAEE